MAHTDLPTAPVDLSDPLFWAEGDAVREAGFAKLRAEAPVSWQREMEYPEPVPPGPGFWALTKYTDVVHASRHPDLFDSGHGSNIADLPESVNEFLGSIINMDAPRHTRLRRIVNRGFTPRRINELEELVRARARRIVDDAGELGECDLVPTISAAMPIQIICDMIGIPESQHTHMLELSNAILSGGDPEYGGTIEAAFGAAIELAQYAQELGERRIVDPTDDITSALVNAEVDGEKLTPGEFGSFFVLLVVAGNETTRNAISHGVHLLTTNPDQRRIWQDDVQGVAPTAIEEIVRYATPVIHFRRTATADTLIGGQEVKAGEKVVLWYNSANRDSDAFPDPDRFDVRRSPNEHVGFGGGGPHFCLGANLARREIKVMFEELFDHLPDIESTGDPDLLLSAFIHGIKHLPVQFTPKKPRARA
jgi:cytochrome P450